MQTRSASDLSPHTGPPARCPRCAAAVRGDVPWCLTCYARFDGVPADAGPAVPAAADPSLPTAADPAPPTAVDPSPPAAADPAPSTAVDPAPPTGPGIGSSRPDDEPDPGRDDLEAVAARMLAELAVAGDHPRWTRRLPRTRAGRAALVSVLLAGCSGVLLGGMQLVGLAL